MARPSTAWDIYRHLNNSSAEMHRSFAERTILDLAESLATVAPLRGSFLAAQPVRRVLEGAVLEV